MTSKVSIRDVLDLSVVERILLVEEIWNSIACFPEAVALTDAHRWELDARFDAYHKGPAAGASREDVKARISRNT